MSLISFMKVTSGTLHFEKKIRFKFKSVDFLHQNPHAPKKRSVFFLLMSIFNIIFLRNYKLTLFQQGCYQMLYSYTVGFDCKTIDFGQCFKVLIVQIF